MDLVERIKERVKDPSRAVNTDLTGAPAHIYKPATAQQIAAAEKRMGFPLPDLLRRLYTEVGNGGYGPGYGLIGVKGGHLDDGETIDQLNVRYREPDEDDPTWYWPERMINVCHWGCGLYSCADASKPEAPVYGFDCDWFTNLDTWTGALFPHRPSLEDWLEAWLDDVDLWEDFGKAYDASAAEHDLRPKAK